MNHILRRRPSRSMPAYISCSTGHSRVRLSFFGFSRKRGPRAVIDGFCDLLLNRHFLGRSTAGGPGNCSHKEVYGAISIRREPRLDEGLREAEKRLEMKGWMRYSVTPGIVLTSLWRYEGNQT